jgi:predicted PurR-regulated permease PerM
MQQIDDSKARKLLFTNAVVRVGMIAFLVVMCLRVIAPFANLVLWTLILAISLSPLHQGLAKWLGGRQGPAAALLVIACLLLIGTPTVMLGGSFAKRVHKAYNAYENNTVSIKQPSPADNSWSLAAKNLPAFLEKNKESLKKISKRALSAGANTAGFVALFLGALILAGILMAYGESGTQTIQRIFCRLTDPVTGPRLHKLSTATIRSVATGVVGVAFIQALLLGIGFIMADIPGAGVLAIVVLLLGIMQLPVSVISLPVIAYLWWSGDASTLINIVYTIYFLVAGLADNVLKPLMLGRGVEVPMPVILIGALGGMVTDGIIGMFVGAVLLAVGYQVFMDWVNNVEEGTSAAPGHIETAGQTLDGNLKVDS